MARNLKYSVAIIWLIKIWINTDRKLSEDDPVVVPLDFHPLTVIPTYGIIAGLDSQLVKQKATGFSTFKLKVSVLLFLAELTVDTIVYTGYPGSIIRIKRH
jgi:RIC1